MRRDHLDAVLAQLLIEWIAVVGAIADQIFRLGLDHVEVEAQLYQPNFVVIGGMRADRERQSMTIHDCHDFHAFPALRRSDPRPATLRHHERRIDEAHMLPQSYPNYKSVHRRFQTWCRDEVLRRVLMDIANELRDKGALDEAECFIDATFVMAKGGGAGIGPTKRGKGMKIMAIVDRHGLPLSVST